MSRARIRVSAAFLLLAVSCRAFDSDPEVLSPAQDSDRPPMARADCRNPDLAHLEFRLDVRDASGRNPGVSPVKQATDSDREAGKAVSAFTFNLFVDDELSHLVGGDRNRPLSLNRLSAERRADSAVLLQLCAHFTPDVADACLLMPVLRRELTSPEVSRRSRAAIGLGKLGAAAVPAEPELRRACEDAEPVVRLYAAFALWQIKGSPDVALRVLREGLRNEHPDVPDLAALLLGEMGAQAAAAVPDLCTALDHPDPYVRAQSMFALGSIGAAASAGVPALCSAAVSPGNTAEVKVHVLMQDHGKTSTKDTMRPVRSYAMRAIEQIEAASQGQTPAKTD